MYFNKVCSVILFTCVCVHVQYREEESSKVISYSQVKVKRTFKIVVVNLKRSSVYIVSINLYLVGKGFFF